MKLIQTAAPSFVLSLLLVAVVLGGGLNPPPGSVTPSLKTLTEVEPRIVIGPDTTPGDTGSMYRITAPGSYYLTGNMTVGGSKSAIEIAASDVTIDLNGFLIDGAAVRPAIVRDVAVVVSRVTIRNGVITSSTSGIDLFDVSEVRLDRIACIGHSGQCITVGDRAHIVDCNASENERGIVAGAKSVIHRCRAINNLGGGGITVGSGSWITECVALRNGLGSPSTFGGIHLTVSTTNVVVSDCYLVENDIGISCSGTGCTIVRNVAKGNPLGNYSIGAGNHVGAIIASPATAGAFANISN